MKWPWISRKKHEAEMDAIERIYTIWCSELKAENKRLKERFRVHERVSSKLDQLEVFAVKLGHSPDAMFRIVVTMDAERMHFIVHGSEASLDYIAEDIKRRVMYEMRPLVTMTKLPTKLPGERMPLDD